MTSWQQTLLRRNWRPRNRILQRILSTRRRRRSHHNHQILPRILGQEKEPAGPEKDLIHQESPTQPPPTSDPMKEEKLSEDPPQPQEPEEPDFSHDGDEAKQEAAGEPTTEESKDKKDSSISSLQPRDNILVPGTGQGTTSDGDAGEVLILKHAHSRSRSIPPKSRAKSSAHAKSSLRTRSRVPPPNHHQDPRPRQIQFQSYPPTSRHTQAITHPRHQGCLGSHCHPDSSTQHKAAFLKKTADNIKIQGWGMVNCDVATTTVAGH